MVQTGVQVLFAFLLTVPFQNAFGGVSHFERGVYFVTLLLAALSAACLIAPTAQHRFLFRIEDKQHIVFLGNKLAIAGLAFLTLAMAGALLLVTTKLFGMSVGPDHGGRGRGAVPGAVVRDAAEPPAGGPAQARKAIGPQP